jgi:predicted 2-oxoglutarate/Fe(II)-dependent dioxygenase YbiX
MKAVQIADGIFVIENFLSEKECRDHIKFCDTQVFEKAHISNHRNNQRLIVDSKAKSEDLWSKLQRISSFGAIRLNERIRYYCYQKGQEFDWHADGRFKSAFGEESKYTFIIYLNHKFKGGETKFTKSTIIPKTGMALIFPHQLLHQGAEVRKGVKYVLRSDLMFF